MRHVAVSNVVAMAPDNVIATHFDFDVTSRGGIRAHNTCVALTTISGAKVVRDQIFVFDTGDTFRAMWGAAPSARRAERAEPHPALV